LWLYIIKKSDRTRKINEEKKTYGERETKKEMKRETKRQRWKTQSWKSHLFKRKTEI
jgi:hypothetical protein